MGSLRAAGSSVEGAFLSKKFFVLSLRGEIYRY